MKAAQLPLDLRMQRTPARELPVIERLHAVLRRRGINPTWRTSSDKSGQILLMPCLGVPRGYLPIDMPADEHGIPASGRWESLCCAWTCGDRIVDVGSYRQFDADGYGPMPQSMRERLRQDAARSKPAPREKPFELQPSPPGRSRSR